MFYGGATLDGGATFAVVFYDGEREINLGNVAVDPTLNFKSLLSILSKRTGILTQHLSVYLAAVGSDRKIPVTAKINLAAVRNDGAAYYLFVKRSKRSKKSPTSGKDLSLSRKNPPENVMLLRRGGAEATPVSPFTTSLEYVRRLRNLQKEREAFLMNMGFGINNSAVARETSNGAGGGGGCEAMCEECLKAAVTGIDDGFHLCVNDKVTLGFRSPAGPISRPQKNSDDDCP